jgi:hypothetical protein
MTTRNETDRFIENVLSTAPKRSFNDPQYQSGYQMQVTGATRTSQNFDRKTVYGTLQQRRDEYDRESNATCGHFCCKFLLYMINIAILLAGLGICGFAIYLKETHKTPIAQMLENSKKVEYGVIGMGVFLCLFGLYGIVTARYPKRCLLFMYFILMAIFVLIAAGALAASVVLAFKDSFLHSAARSAWVSAVESKPDLACKTQLDFNCTGFDHPCYDKFTQKYSVNESCANCTKALPDFVKESKQYPKCMNGTITVVCESCYATLKKDITDNLLPVLVSTGSTFGVLLLGLIVTICLCKQKRIGSKEQELYDSVNYKL